jgi:hypothetical protein
VWNRFVGKVAGAYNRAQKAKNPAWKNVTKYEVIEAITRGAASGLKLEIQPSDAYDFGRNLARVVGDTSILNMESIQGAALVLAEDYCTNNPHLSFDNIKPEDILASLESQATA